MGTRGMLGIVIDGQLRGTYNHFDSYPEGLGAATLTYLHKMDLEEAREAARGLKVVTDEVPPTPEEIEKLRRFADIRVSSRSHDEWYTLLRQTQGNLGLILEAGYIEDGAGFADDSLFCEWAYVVDLDNEVLEIYRGSQTQPHTVGRFANNDKREAAYEGGDTYYPVKLIKTWSLSELPTEDEFLGEIYAEVREDEE